MIKKLKSKIFLIIMVALTTITLGTIIIFTYINYRNTINTSTFFMDRVFGRDERNAMPDGIEPNERFKDVGTNEILDENNINEENRTEQRPEMPEIDGFYSVIVGNSGIININNNYSEEIQNYAIEVANKNRETGIIGNYIYRTEKQRNGEVRVTLVENEEAISRVKSLIIIAVGIGLFSLVIIYIVAKKVAEIIVKPVEETFSKQVQFISDASHELKTPLAVIEANADVLEQEQGKSKWLTYIQNEIESMNKLINELLLLAKIENVDSLREKEEFNVSEEAEMITSMFESMAYEKQVKIETNIQENVKMLGAKEDIEHIMSTLVDNAIKHTKSEGKVVVDLKKEQSNNIIIQVKNEGEEIPKEEREKIFERFYRVDKARNRNEKRYGLGLAIAKSTVQKYKGTIDVDYKDGFTIFKVKMGQ